jgi:hypothetical protein
VTHEWSEEAQHTDVALFVTSPLSPIFYQFILLQCCNGGNISNVYQKFALPMLLQRGEGRTWVSMYFRSHNNFLQAS